MKKIENYGLVIILLLATLTGGCKKKEIPTLTTAPVTDLTMTSAKTGGNITSDGNAGINQRGVVWSTSQNPTTSDNTTADGTGAGSFSSIITGLTEGTTYYARAYATNSEGTGYGDEISFSSLPAGKATITTRAVTDITANSAKAGGDISSDGGAPVTVKGICWSTAENPTTSDSFTSDGDGTAGYASNMTGLVNGTTYFVRAYATNKAGTAYGNQVTFKTAGFPTLTTRAITNITINTARSGGDISSDGGEQITVKGVCWNTAENPTTSNSFTSDGDGTAGFASNITGLVQGTTYFVRAYATNKAGTAYGNQVTFKTAGIPILTTRTITGITFNSAKSGGDISDDGGLPVTAKGICWNTAENPTISNSFTTNGTGKEGFSSDMTGLVQGTTYYVRAYATNAAGTAYGNQLSFRTVQVNTPVVTTSVITGVTTTTAVSGGKITNNGGAGISAKGVVWGTAPGPTIAGSKTNEGAGTDDFVSNISGLTPGTVYYVRAYATNVTGTGYGNEIKFSTSITDVEGNVYKTILIGNQLWTAENLKSTRFNNNTPIPNVADSLVWITMTTPAYSWYRNMPSRKDTYGALYNWFTVEAGNLCPQGWHVPTQLEYRAMEQAIGVPADSTVVWGWRGKGAGTHLKNTAGWDSLGNGDNTTGFSALPGGYRAWVNGQYRGLGFITYFWTSTDDAINHKPTVAWYRRLDSTDNRIYNATTEKTGGKSVRCMKNP
jgi:uncharacterized protein (TIGR02145 family)